jgi:hypothetical protein
MNFPYMTFGVVTLPLTLTIGYLCYIIYKTNKDHKKDVLAFHVKHRLGAYSASADNESSSPHGITLDSATVTDTPYPNFRKASVIIRKPQTQNMDEETQQPPPFPEKLETPVGTLYSPHKNETLSSLILSEKTTSDLQRGMAKVTLENFILDDMGWESIDSTRRSILNFYGPPGVGKTKAAMVIANELKRPLLHVDYSKIVSKWVGSTGRNIKKIFDTASSYNAILFLDEADSLLNQRSENVESSNSEYLNQEKNVLMQELDRFNGVVILTTNLFTNYDAALLRRISQHVEFKLPDEALLLKLIEKHIPTKTKLDASVDLMAVAKASRGLSGGDIKNVIRESIVQCVLEFKSGKIKEPSLSQRHLLNQVGEIRSGKDKHKGVRNKLGISE